MNTDIHKLEPAYEFTGNEQSFLLHRGQAEMCLGENRYIGEGEVRLDLLPRAGIRIHGFFHDVEFADLMVATSGDISSFSLDARRVDGFMVNGNANVSTQDYNIIWCPEAEPLIGAGDDTNQMKEVVFHLFNFVNFDGTVVLGELRGMAWRRIAHVELGCDKWQVELQSHFSTSVQEKMLKKEGGYRCTHFGRIVKVDGGLFSGKDAKEFIDALQLFLSFARGASCDLICPVGFDRDRGRVWASWSSPRDPWCSVLTWFGPRDGSQLAELFPKFMIMWAEEGWRTTLREVIYWYVNANQSSRGVDIGIILTQAALERLSFEYAVKHKRQLSVKGFKKSTASEKYRVLFSSLGIPNSIPVETPVLEALSREMKWKDAPHALTEIRNSLIHPVTKHRGSLEQAYVEAWKLGMWYLEMGILAICGYSGTYGNRLRLRRGQEAEDVPWKG